MFTISNTANTHDTNGDKQVASDISNVYASITSGLSQSAGLITGLANSNMATGHNNGVDTVTATQRMETGAYTGCLGKTLSFWVSNPTSGALTLDVGSGSSNTINSTAAPTSVSVPAYTTLRQAVLNVTGAGVANLTL